MKILQKVDELFERLETLGKLSVGNSRAFVRRMAIAIQPVLDFCWLTSGSSGLGGIVEKFLKRAKAGFNASDGGAHQRWLLFHARYRVMQMYKDSGQLTRRLCLKCPRGGVENKLPVVGTLGQAFVECEPVIMQGQLE